MTGERDRSAICEKTKAIKEVPWRRGVPSVTAEYHAPGAACDPGCFAAGATPSPDGG